MSIGTLHRIARHKISDLFMVIGQAMFSGTYTSGGEYVTANQLGLSSIQEVTCSNCSGGYMAYPVLTTRGDSCFRLKTFSAENTETSGSLTTNIDFIVYGR